jgi:peptidoglycan/LPS O-acetylase OafA/YrhL
MLTSVRAASATSSCSLAVADPPAAIPGLAPRDAHSSAAHMPQLDSVRAVAVLGVMLWHFWGPPFGMLGVLGVQLFFVLSGFLITGILLKARSTVVAGRRSRSFVLRQFYIRRVLRIFPLYYLTLVVCWAAGAWVSAPAEFRWHAVYLGDFYFAAIGDFPSELAHFWTLAVEEQFYLVWPFVVLLTPTRTLPWFFALIAAVGPLYRGLCALFGLDGGALWIWMYTPPFASVDSLAIGGILAYGWARGPSGRRFVRRHVTGASVAGLLWLLLTSVPSIVHLDLRISSAAIDKTAWALIFGWVITGAAGGFGGFAGRILETGSLRYIGKISYALYIFHPMMEHVLRWASKWAGVPYPDGHVASMVLRFAATIALASLSWQLFERPLNDLKARISYA